LGKVSSFIDQIIEMSSADREELRNTLEQIRMIEHFLEEIKSRRTH